MKHANVYGSNKTLLATFMLSALAAGCGGGGGGRDPILGTGGTIVFASPVNAIAPGAACPVAGASIPTVTQTDPADLNQTAPTSTTGVAGGGKAVTATFSQAMNPATINAATFSLAQTGGAALIPASVTYDDLSRVATLKTSSALATNTNYTAVIQSGATSATGTPVGCPYVWTFKTGATATAAPAAVNLGRASSFGIASAAGMTNVIRAPNTRINGNAVLYPLTTCNTVPVDTAGGFGICGGAAPSISGQVYSTLFAPAGGRSG